MLPHSKPSKTNSTSQYLSRERDYVTQAQTTDSSDVNIGVGPAGTTITAVDSGRSAPFIYRGEYNTGSEYRVSDVVSVNTGSTYSTVSGSKSSTIGTWLCIKNPPVITSASYAALSSSYKLLYNDYRTVDKCYAPVTPLEGYWIQLGGGSSDFWC